MSEPVWERDPKAWEDHLAEGNARQARKRIAADALLRDHAGRVLLVDPNYKPHWDLPGGMVEANEPPVVALHRELREELGHTLSHVRLLVVDWVPPHGPWDDQLAMVFDGGVLGDGDVARLHIADKELTRFGFFLPDQVEQLVQPRLWRRIQSAAEVIRSGSTAAYLHDGRPIDGPAEQLEASITDSPATFRRAPRPAPVRRARQARSRGVEAGRYRERD